MIFVREKKSTDNKFHYLIRWFFTMSETFAYETDESFHTLIIECGRALNTLETVLRNIRFPITQYFECLEIYQSPVVEKFMIKYLRLSLTQEDLAVLEEYETFKGQHGQTDEQKAIKTQAANITLKLSRWYVKIGNSIWPPLELSSVVKADTPSSKYTLNFISFIDCTVSYFIMTFYSLKENPSFVIFFARRTKN